MRKLKLEEIKDITDYEGKNFVSLVTNSYFSFLKWRKPVLILSEASDFGMPSDDDVVPSWAVICSTFSAAVAFSSVFSLYLKYHIIRY